MKISKQAIVLIIFIIIIVFSIYSFCNSEVGIDFIKGFKDGYNDTGVGKK